MSLALLALIAIIPGKAQAFNIQKSSNFMVESGKKVEKNIYAFSDNVTIEGEVDGDVFCIADNLIIMGYVDGDVICLAKNINIQGEITGDLRALVGGPVSVSGKIGKNASIISQSFNLPRLSSIDKDLLVFAKNAQIDGIIGRDIDGAFSTVSISGHIGGDVNVNLDDPQVANPISIDNQAYIGGSLNYKAPSKRLSVSDEAYVNGKVNYEFKDTSLKKKPVFGFGWFYSLFSCLIIGILLSLMFKRRLNKIISRMTTDYKASLGWGTIMFFLMPAVILIIMATLIGIPLALILGFVWFLFLIASRIIVGIWIGKWILKHLKWQEDNLIIASIFGIIVAKLLFTIPVVGWLAGFLAMLWVPGAFWLYLRGEKKEKHEKHHKKSSKK